MNLRCPGCGYPIDESHDDEHKAAWIAEQVICWACASSERRKSGGAAPPGAKYQIHNRARDVAP